jgi:uncharacterized OsmC-like protein
MTSIDLKTWTARVASIGKTPLTIKCPGQVGARSPVEYLLIAVGTCYTLSFRMALHERQLALQQFEVVVMGRKAADEPVRLQSISIELILSQRLDEDIEALSLRAKQLCTVTNTLAGNPTLHLEIAGA